MATLSLPVKIIGIALVFGLCGGVGWSVWWSLEPLPPPAPVTGTPPVAEPVATSTVGEQIIGYSVAGRPLVAYTYGSGEKRLLFVGGIHGGYEWNTVFLAYRMMDYLADNPTLIPDTVSVTIIPNANPDGVYDIVGVEGRFALADVPAGSNSIGRGRFNANLVDLNRNFACQWQATSTWKGKPVSAGTAAFSEPEAAALRDYVVTVTPTAAVFWHSAGDAVYGSACTDGILPATLTLMNTYASAAQYSAIPLFTAYPITGDAEGWLASIGIPAVTVELSTHDTIDWERNVAGVEAILAAYR